MRDTCCALCGKDLPQGTLKYIVHINIMSDFDEGVSCSEEGASGEVQGLFDEVESEAAGVAEDAYCQELSLYLCRNCKRRFARDLVSGGEEDFGSPKKDVGTVYH